MNPFAILAPQPTKTELKISLNKHFYIIKLNHKIFILPLITKQKHPKYQYFLSTES